VESGLRMFPPCLSSFLQTAATLASLSLDFTCVYACSHTPPASPHRLKPHHAPAHHFPHSSVGQIFPPTIALAKDPRAAILPAPSVTPSAHELSASHAPDSYSDFFHHDTQEFPRILGNSTSSSTVTVHSNAACSRTVVLRSCSASMTLSS
jgi:hypothetical protein